MITEDPSVILFKEPPGGDAPGTVGRVVAAMRPPLKAESQEQFALTILATIKAGAVDTLRALLEEIGKDVEGNPYIAFRELSTVHFCRFVVLPADPDLQVPASLAFESNYDGDLDAHLDELVRVGEQGLKAMYGLCEGFPGAGGGVGAIKAYLRDHAVPYTAFYIGHRGLSQRWVQNDIQVRAAIQAYLNEEQKNPGWPPSPDDLRAGIQKHLATLPSLSTAPFDRKMPPWSEAFPWLIPAALLGLAFLPLVGGVVALWAAVLRVHEERDRPDPPQTNFPITNLVTLEDRAIQNQLTHLVPIRPGFFRLLTLKGVLFTINTLARYMYNKGELGGIPSIHFARWAIIDGGKRLLFFSNYDGSWESYLGDFIDKASTGLTSVWSNTEGFPQARWLAFDGATHAQQFKQWTRAHQIPTQVWYTAYPHATVMNVISNAEIRRGVQGTLTGEALAQWLERL